MLTAQVWIGVVVSVMAWGTILWMLQKLWHWMYGGRQFSLASSVFYGWGLLLEDIPYEPPANPTGQVGIQVAYKTI